MKYEVVNEELRIFSCTISNLSLQQINCFLHQWEKDSCIAQLTLFYDEEEQAIVLNKDNVNYNFLEKLALKYMGLDNEKRRNLADRVKSEWVKEAIKVLDNALAHMNNYKEFFILVHQKAIQEEYEIPWGLLEMIRNKYNNSNEYWWMYKAFEFGFINGKRAERARRKIS